MRKTEIYDFFYRIQGLLRADFNSKQQTDYVSEVIWFEFLNQLSSKLLLKKFFHMKDRQSPISWPQQPQYFLLIALFSAWTTDLWENYDSGFAHKIKFNLQPDCYQVSYEHVFDSAKFKIKSDCYLVQR